MNAMTETLPRAAVAPPHATHKFKLLLKREYWEHRGGFLWAPAIAAGIFGLMTLFAVISAMVLKQRAAREQIDIGGQQVIVGGLDLSSLTQTLRPEELSNLGGALDVFTMVGAAIPFLVLAFVVFFYSLGTLYDDRKDRSSLFWKSLPVSDFQTVFAKVFTATLVAPLIAVLAGFLAIALSLALLSLLVLLNGGNPLTLVWGPASPLNVGLTFLAAVPVFAVWALPTVGWLMLCSAWARSKPFLWAVMIPVVLGAFVSWFDVMQFFDLDTSWYWRNLAMRSLGSTFPVTWLSAANLSSLDISGAQDVSKIANISSMYSLFSTPQMWIGAAAGTAMIFAAIRLRRWRDEG